MKKSRIERILNFAGYILLIPWIIFTIYFITAYACGYDTQREIVKSILAISMIIVIIKL